MRKKAVQYFLLLLCLAMLLYSCEKAADYYIGMNQQPEFTVNTFEEGLNIFGLLRPDQKEDFNKSFVFVQQNWPALNLDNLNIIQNTNINVYRLENGVIVDSVEFPLMPSDSLFGDTLYRPSVVFHPEAGQQYQLICYHPDFPVAVGETIIPSKPQIDSSTINIEGNTLEFVVVADTLIKMMDVYLITDSGSKQAGRYVTDGLTDTYITLELQDDLQIVKIFSYDNNLATYYANSNISLNFNKYRTTFSTLESGFGVFGSMNYTEIIINRDNF